MFGGNEKRWMTMTMRMMLLLLKELCHISLTKPHTHLCARPQGAKLLRTLRRRSTKCIAALRGSIECIVAVEEKYRRVHCCINVLGKGVCVPGIVGGQTHWPAPLPVKGKSYQRWRWQWSQQGLGRQLKCWDQIQIGEENTFKIWQEERKVDDRKC